MRVAFYSCSAVLTEPPLLGTLLGTPPFPSGTALVFDCVFHCNTFSFESRRDSVSASWKNVRESQESQKNQ